MHFQCITVYSKISKIICECLPHFDCRICQNTIEINCIEDYFRPELFLPITPSEFCSLFKCGIVFLFKNILKKENFAQFKICPLLQCLYMIYWAVLLYSFNCFILYSEDEWSWSKIDVTLIWCYIFIWWHLIVTTILFFQMQNENPKSFIEKFSFILNQYLQALGGIVPIFNYMVRCWYMV